MIIFPACEIRQVQQVQVINAEYRKVSRAPFDCTGFEYTFLNSGSE